MTNEKTRKNEDKDDLKDQVDQDTLTDEDAEKVTGSQFAPRRRDPRPISFDDPGPPATD